MNTTWRRELVPLVTIAAMFVAAAWSWPRVPERLPIHWNAAGVADGFGGKFMGLVFLPLVAVGMYALMFILPRFDPGRRNYQSFAGAYATLRAAMVLFFGVLYVATLLAAYGRPVNMTTFIMPAVGLLFMVIGNLMGKIRPNHFVGIRTPWTLSSKQSWNKTHRLGGWMFMILGAAFIVVGVMAPSLFLPVMIGAPLLLICVLLPYSYNVYARDPERISPAGVAPAGEDSLDDNKGG